jgi:hypothetical protein
MKKCKGCEVTVDDHFQVGDICPACHKRWSSEHVVKLYSDGFRFPSGKFFWIILGSVFLLGTSHSLIADYHYGKIANGYAKQWFLLETDSLNSVADDILLYNEEIRRKLFYMTTKHYLTTLNKSNVETMIELIVFVPVIDSAYHSRWEFFNVSRKFHPYGLYLKIDEIANNIETPQRLRLAAETAICKMKKSE